jgi:hypothetical protein
MRLDVLFQVLWPLERLAAEIALVRLQRHMDAKMRGDVIALHRLDGAVGPFAVELQIVGALSANVLVAHMVLSAI